MTVSTSLAQENHAPEIQVRDRRFSRDAMASRWWMRGDPIGTAFYNVLSAGFPYTESFFIEAVRAFREGTPPKLAAEIAAFTGQEAVHAREHVAFNRRVTMAGYDVSGIQAKIDGRLMAVRAKPPIAALTVTMALEHYTAIVAHEALVNPRHLADAEPEIATMWRWHALEEVEHKAVAYDTWLHATRDWSPFKRWSLRSKVMLLVTRNWIDRIKGTIELVRQDGYTGLAPRLRVIWYLFGRPGILRKIIPAWAKFFLPGFHPWNHDNRALLAEVRKSLPPA